MLIRLVALNARFVHSAPALFYLRQQLAENLPAARLEICQLTINDPYYETLQGLLDQEPSALFFSVYVWNAVYTRRLLLDLRQVRPDLPLVLGGPQAPHLDLPREVAAAGVCVVQGPAEGLGPDFYADLAAGRLPSTYQADFAAPFRLPYRPEDFAAELQNRHVYYESSRGCPFACSYCLSSARRGVAYRELQEVLVELELLLAARPKSIRLVDRTFNAPPERALEIWRFLVARSREGAAAPPGPGAPAEAPDAVAPAAPPSEPPPEPPATVFHFEIAPDLFTDQALEFLATVPPGLFRFEIGLQSFNPASLAAVNRYPDLARAREAIRRLVAGDNIHLHLDLILGLPFETRASYLESLNGIMALRPHQLQLGLLKVLPDTPLAARRQEFALRCCQEPPYPVLATRWLTRDEVAELYRLGELIESYYNPRFFLATLNYLLRREINPAAFFQELAATCATRNFFGRARTQELLSSALADHFRRRDDAQLALELLRFDWLACGHRRWPEHLQRPVEAGRDRLKEARDRLWHQLPDNLPPFFTSADRSAFFKRSVFAPFSAVALEELGLGDGRRGGVVAFLPGKNSGLKARQATAVFELTGSPPV
ncbi:B12-binding domain-containing radical SAM protein [Desulfurivibrio alkaliphilus]|uniref:Radical SAM domain protein n=1 Tax=Desulfurivibrio alkaliphilus (strain DSM 19089 / UNIQEM U267 / AHT2) TaxID=589865 RepID=D6Z525_DESAT|nr:DUF4080 domain-containing protein [Desulfurivibrio alkaliphilus]ADH86650.1 Radical SAM domain protein [Desulfurivibrio alkaliphilus AHT 2]